MNEGNLHPWIDPELEARIVALVLGEASDFEREELERLIEAQPELAVFKKRIEAVHGLLGEAARGEEEDKKDAWKLSPSRREKLLTAIDGDPEKGEDSVVAATVAPAGGGGRPRSPWRTLSRIAAVFCVLGVIGATLHWMTPRMMLKDARIATSERAVPQAEMDGYFGNAEPPPSQVIPSAMEPARPVSDLSIAGGVNFAMDAEGRVEADARSALAVMQDTLSGSATAGEGSSERMSGADFLAFRESQVDGKGLDRSGLRSKTEAPEPGAAYGVADGRVAVIAGKEMRDLDNIRLGEALTMPEVQGKESARGRGRVAGRAGEDVMLQVDPPESLDYSFSAEVEDEKLGRRALGRQVAGDIPAIAAAPAPRPTPAPTPAPRLMPAPAATQDFGGVPPAQMSDVERIKNVAQKLSKKPAVVTGAAGPQADPQRDGGGTHVATVGDQLHRKADLDAEGAPLAGAKRRNIDVSSEALAKLPVPADLPDDAIQPGATSGAMGSSRPAATVGAGSVVVDAAEIARIEDLEEMTDEFAVSFEKRGDLKTKTELLSEQAPALAQVEAREHKKSLSALTAPDTPAARKELERKLRESMQDTKDIAIQLGDQFEDLAAKMPAELEAQIGQTRAVIVPETEASNGLVTHMYRVPPTFFADSDATDADPFSGPDDALEGAALKSRPIAKSILEEKGIAFPPGASAYYDSATGQLVVRNTPDNVELVESFVDGLGVEGEEGHLMGPKFLPVKLNLPALRVAPPAGLQEKTAATEPFSTFSLHVSDVSFKLAQAALAKGEWPDASRIRIEEFVNAFDYGDPMPSESEKVACRMEQAIHPFLQQRNLLRVSMRTAAAGRAADTPLRLTFLLDNSGSMERTDRQKTVRRAFALLADQLQPEDKVTLISFARQPRLVADRVGGDKGKELVDFVTNLPSEGGTNLEAALTLAFEKARQQKTEHAQNRVILLTDGAANLGDAEPESLSRMIESMRNAGIAFDAAGIGAEGLNDEILEALTRKGDGRYYLLDRPEDADAGFARQIAGALRPAAKNVKIQVEFNPKRVGRYKLLGFEKHRLQKEDFRDDGVDAAEMAAEEAGVAVYQFQPLPDGEGDVGSVSVRFRDLSSGQMIEKRWPIPYDPGTRRPDETAPSMSVATAAALFAAKLKGDPLGELVDLDTLARLIAALPESSQTAPRVAELRQMIEQARRLSQ